MIIQFDYSLQFAISDFAREQHRCFSQEDICRILDVLPSSYSRQCSKRKIDANFLLSYFKHLGIIDKSINLLPEQSLLTFLSLLPDASKQQILTALNAKVNKTEVVFK